MDLTKLTQIADLRRQVAMASFATLQTKRAQLSVDAERIQDELQEAPPSVEDPVALQVYKRHMDYLKRQLRELRMEQSRLEAEVSKVLPAVQKAVCQYHASSELVSSEEKLRKSRALQKLQQQG